MSATVLRKVGNSSGVTIPQQVCSDAGFNLGEELILEAAPGMIVLMSQRANVNKRIGVAAGKKLVRDDWYSLEADREIAELFEAAL